MIRLAVFLSFLIWVVPAVLIWPAPTGAVIGLEKQAEGKVVQVIDGDTVILADAIDGARQVRLTGIQAPKLPLGRKEFKQWPLAPEAKQAMEALTLGKTVALVFGGQRMDRHGRLLAHLFIADGSAIWIQGEMIRRGLARVYTFADNRTFAREMYAFEQDAREARRGIWADPFYAVRTPEPKKLMRDKGSFQLVEGTVQSAAEVKGVVFLNFGDNWRTDFTVRLPKKTARLFKKEGFGPETYDGKRIRVRGWVKDWNGPMIELTHPEQIEILER